MCVARALLLLSILLLLLLLLAHWIHQVYLGSGG
jgi:hypothetical protein